MKAARPRFRHLVLVLTLSAAFCVGVAFVHHESQSWVRHLSWPGGAEYVAVAEFLGCVGGVVVGAGFAGIRGYFYQRPFVLFNEAYWLVFLSFTAISVFLLPEFF
jgi:hypothetical protein